MNTRSITALLAAALLPFAAMVHAQEGRDSESDRRASEKARQKYEQQMREAERQSREAARQLREAERQIREAARQIEKLTQEKVTKEIERHMVVFGDHPRIGVILRSEAHPPIDVIGAEIQGLSPGGPAEEAGVKAGDIVVKVNGKVLTTPFIDVDIDGDESAPAARLREFVTSLADGDTVVLDVKRGNEIKTLNVTARRTGGPLVKVWSPRDGSFDIDIDLKLDQLRDLQGHATFLAGDWLGLELVTLDADLGEYFGTTEGVLLVRTPKDESLQLRAGDVIQKIGDRAVRSPSQTMRALRSFEPGDTVSIEVLRRQQQLTLQGVVPKSPRGRLLFVPAPPAPPAAPAAPVPPEAPAPPARPSRGEAT